MLQNAGGSLEPEDKVRCKLNLSKLDVCILDLFSPAANYVYFFDFKINFDVIFDKLELSSVSENSEELFTEALDC